jgi:hypothetical protein
MAYSTGVRVTKLRTKDLPKLGAKWRGSSEEFTEFLLNVIPKMPASVAAAMQRYYVDGESQRLTTYGRPETADSRYYLFLLQGRSILATMVNVAQSDQKSFRMLEEIYGQPR